MTSLKILNKKEVVIGIAHNIKPLNAKIIGVLTEDFRLYHELVRIMKQREISFASLTFGNDIPPYVGVIITTKDESIYIDTQLKIVAEDFGYPKRYGDEVFNAIIDNALVMLLGKRQIDRLIVGIDPGKRPGIALIAHGIVLQTIQTCSPRHAISFLRTLLEVYAKKRTLVRVGNGAPHVRNIIINAMLEMGVKVELVDEDSTSVRYGREDKKAAIAIGRKGGRRITVKLATPVTRGEIRYLQDQSRIESNGKITISSDLAVDVAKGNLSLEEAIELQRRKGEMNQKKNA